MASKYPYTEWYKLKIDGGLPILGLQPWKIDEDGDCLVPIQTTYYIMPGERRCCALESGEVDTDNEEGAEQDFDSTAALCEHVATHHNIDDYYARPPVDEDEDALHRAEYYFKGMCRIHMASKPVRAAPEPTTKRAKRTGESSAEPVEVLSGEEAEEEGVLNWDDAGLTHFPGNDRGVPRLNEGHAITRAWGRHTPCAKCKQADKSNCTYVPPCLNHAKIFKYKHITKAPLVDHFSPERYEAVCARKKEAY
ncbi:hypothetical protein LTR35_001792 [Friedmanniomyces endolithicus]|nr:hypothetical protein LTR35_001792 [Friedmanniomyces endolithicus]KAK0296878.1 hypothetical protein LTS00_004678 [Friedmanniomyces endolithicus]